MRLRITDPYLTHSSHLDRPRRRKKPRWNICCFNFARRITWGRRTKLSGLSSDQSIAHNPYSPINLNSSLSQFPSSRYPDLFMPQMKMPRKRRAQRERALWFLLVFRITPCRWPMPFTDVFVRQKLWKCNEWLDREAKLHTSALSAIYRMVRWWSRSNPRALFHPFLFEFYFPTSSVHWDNPRRGSHWRERAKKNRESLSKQSRGRRFSRLFPSMECQSRIHAEKSDSVINAAVKGLVSFSS